MVKKNPIDAYFKAKMDLEALFQYHEDWSAIPWEDARQYFWYIEKGKEIKELWCNGYKGKVIFWESLEKVIEDHEWYKNEIYTQRHLPKWVYESQDYTMVVVDTHTDGNKFLQIFDNTKRLMELPKELALRIKQLEEYSLFQYQEHLKKEGK